MDIPNQYLLKQKKEIDPSRAKDTYNESNKDISVAGLPSAPEKILCIS